MSGRLRVLMATLIISLLSACSSGDPRALYESLIVEFNDVQSISISALNSVIASGDSQQITVTGTTSQAATVDLSDKVSWSLSDATLASISSDGLLQSLSASATGTVTITATLADFSATFDVTLSDASLVSIEVKADTTDELLSTSVCRPLALKAMGTYDDSPVATVRNITPYVSWDSTTTGATLVSASSGPSITHYQALAIEVTASRDTLSSPAASVSVVDDITSLALSPASLTLSVGSSQGFILQAVYGAETVDNVATAANWASTDIGVVSFPNNDGVMSAVSTGTTTVTANCGSTEASALVTVDTNNISSFEIGPEPTGFALALGSTQQMTATAYYSADPNTAVDVTGDVSWSVENGSVAVLSVDSYGLVSANAEGFAKVVANFSGETADVTVHVVP
ncbi:MAG: Ig-like domain-containing protein [Gammaproteobacteria bacterium]|nr:Ig-like domain-containing protein [Gammaproteobacteria bacterium]